MKSATPVSTDATMVSVSRTTIGVITDTIAGEYHDDDYQLTA